ncbi:hypothetical protein D7243_22695 [Stutzerimonas stutzeri]|nr:hypothetical protein [Stutzerimonas stutzeri]
MSEQKIKYVQHPVSPEQKAELRAQGFKIIDARFAPPGEVVEQQDEAPKPRARKTKPEPTEAE